MPTPQSVPKYENRHPVFRAVEAGDVDQLNRLVSTPEKARIIGASYRYTVPGDTTGWDRADWKATGYRGPTEERMAMLVDAALDGKSAEVLKVLAINGLKIPESGGGAVRKKYDEVYRPGQTDSAKLQIADGFLDVVMEFAPEAIREAITLAMAAGWSGPHCFDKIFEDDLANSDRTHFPRALQVVLEPSSAYSAAMIDRANRIVDNSKKAVRAECLTVVVQTLGTAIAAAPVVEERVDQLKALFQRALDTAGKINLTKPLWASLALPKEVAFDALWTYSARAKAPVDLTILIGGIAYQNYLAYRETTQSPGPLSHDLKAKFESVLARGPDFSRERPRNRQEQERTVSHTGVYGLELSTLQTLVRQYGMKFYEAGVEHAIKRGRFDLADWILEERLADPTNPQSILKTVLTEFVGQAARTPRGTPPKALPLAAVTTLCKHGAIVDRDFVRQFSSVWPVLVNAGVMSESERGETVLTFDHMMDLYDQAVRRVATDSPVA